MRYVRIEKQGPNRVRVLRTLQHGFDGVSALESNPTRDVYAMAEKSTNPRVHVYRIDKGRKDPYEPRVVAKLTGTIHSYYLDVYYWLNTFWLCNLYRNKCSRDTSVEIQQEGPYHCSHGLSIFQFVNMEMDDRARTHVGTLQRTLRVF